MEIKTIDYKCKICNKYYKTYVTLWKHNKKFHNDHNSISPQNNSISPQNNSKYMCNYCNKKYSRIDNLTRHKKTCKDKPTTKEDNINLIEENKIMKQQINELKTQMKMIIEKNKIQPKTLQKINKLNINNDNSVTHNTYITFPHLDYSKIFNSRQIKSILNKQYMSLEESIKQVHFNDNLPEYSNIFISNMKDDLSYVFDGNTIICIKKNNMLYELVDMHINEINLSLEKYRNKLDPSVITVLETFLEKLNDQYTKKIDHDTNKTYPNYKAYKIDHIKLMIYNKTDKNKLELLKTMQLEEKIYEDSETEK
jgi:hypothetical protein